MHGSNVIPLMGSPDSLAPDPVAEARAILVRLLNALTALEGVEPGLLAELRVGLGDCGGMTAEEAIEEARESLYQIRRDVIVHRRGYREF